MKYITERKRHCGQCLDPDKLELGCRMSDTENSSDESEIESYTHSENDSGAHQRLKLPCQVLTVFEPSDSCKSGPGMEVSVSDEPPESFSE